MIILLLLHGAQKNNGHRVVKMKMPFRANLFIETVDTKEQRSMQRFGLCWSNYDNSLFSSRSHHFNNRVGSWRSVWSTRFR